MASHKRSRLSKEEQRAELLDRLFTLMDGFDYETIRRLLRFAELQRADQIRAMAAPKVLKDLTRLTGGAD